MYASLSSKNGFLGELFTECLLNITTLIVTCNKLSCNITGSCRYQLPMILNDLNSNDIMSEVIKNINNVSLLGFKRIVKTFFLDRYSFTCSIPNCYVCG